MIHRLETEDAVALVDAGSGGRLTSLRINGTEIIVGPATTVGNDRDPLDWGMYPMVPFAGRVRGARFSFDGTIHVLPTRADPHAIHGTVDDSAWSIVSCGSTFVEMETGLGRGWPFPGVVRHAIHLSPGVLECVLTLSAISAMPAQVGWHPWFVRPAWITTRFGRWIPRDAEGFPTVATGEDIPDLDGRVDDCFVADGAPVGLSVDGVRLGLESDCSHWVVYTGAEHGICVEPQSGPPNSINDRPQVLEASDALTRHFRITW